MQRRVRPSRLPLLRRQRCATVPRRATALGAAAAAAAAASSSAAAAAALAALAAPGLLRGPRGARRGGEVALVS